MEIDLLKETRRRKFRVKIKSLAEETRIIRSEEKRLGGEEIPYSLTLVRGELQSHRIHVVRKEQRATLLAYAYWRGKPYRLAENKTKKPVPMKRIKEILKSLTWKPDADIESWVAADLVKN